MPSAPMGTCRAGLASIRCVPVRSSLRRTCCQLPFRLRTEGTGVQLVPQYRPTLVLPDTRDPPHARTAVTCRVVFGEAHNRRLRP